MLTLEKAVEMADDCTRRANAEPHAVLNMNPVGESHYVIRTMRDCPTGTPLDPARYVYVSSYGKPPAEWPGFAEAQQRCVCVGLYIERPTVSPEAY